MELGADTAINYQEPGKGNTALHIAYARRDLKTIMLLESYGANREILNREGQKPADLLALTFKQTEQLLDFHTSLDIHEHVFLLELDAFNDKNNLRQIQQNLNTPPKLRSAEPLNIPGASGPGGI